ncbi:hypothetical protein [Loktanella sp. 5RATIMAR09]|uniref:hypothetical protein n=1 Tax=Loktanella sp. 5RATIMAR09 TaxID=1225655 RepID=UPI000AD69267|nr:hypothetical protein [Loktanella sp. 5RATIMAR09]
MKGLQRIEPSETAIYIDGIRYALNGALRAFSRISIAIRKIEDRNTSTLQEAFDILNDCWQIVDCTYRSQQIFKNLAPLNIKDARTKRFNSAADKANGLRNLYHHLSRRVSEMDRSSSPVIGSLSWISEVDNLSCLTLTINSGARDFSVPALRFDREEAKYTENFVFSVMNNAISLETTVNGCRDLSDSIEDFLSELRAHNQSEVRSILFTSTIQPNKKTST